MKKFIVSLFFIVPFLAQAQDLIVKKDGSVIQAKVSEIGITEIKYKKWSNQDGPSYVVSKNEILAINYQNGEKETFEDSTTHSEPATNGPILIEKPAASNNMALVGQYHSTASLKSSKSKSSPAGSGIIIFEVSPSSILSNEDIEISFERSTAYNEGMGTTVLSGKPTFRYEIKIKNKTNSTIYIDLANTFRIPSVGNSFCYFTGESLSISNGSNSGAAMNLGGITGALGIGGIAGTIASSISVGGGNSTSTNKTYNQQRIIMVPPHGHRALAEFHYETIKEPRPFQRGHYKLTSRGEEFSFKDFSNLVGSGDDSHFQIDFWNIHLKKGIVNEGQEVVYSESDTPFKIDYIITYSTSSNFETYTYLPYSLYTKKIIGYETSSWRTVENAIFFDPQMKEFNKKFNNFGENTLYGPITFE